MKNLTEPQLLINEAHGIYIAQLFCQRYADGIINKETLNEDINICLDGPDNEEYIEAWVNVIDNAQIKDDNGQIFNIGNLYESGDLFAIPLDYVYEEF